MRGTLRMKVTVRSALAPTAGVSLAIVLAGGLVPASDAESGPAKPAFSSPAAGSEVSGGQPITATLADTAGQIDQVKFYADDRLVCTTTTSPFTCAFNPSSSDIGVTTLVAVARNSSGE